jgi:hypothetical protein
MAIGARILSNNLSGETVDVTFLPFTGGTIDLGEQTIPFNNLTPYPYGTYEVYVPLYDHTYEVVINQGASGQTFSFVSKLTGSNNHGAATLNFTDLTAQIIDLNVDYTGWYIKGTYPITDYGYGYYFENDSTCDLQWVIFTDALGNIMESYQTNCDCDYDYDLLAGKWVYFNDIHNGILKYFNGKDVYTLTADTTTEYIDVNDSWDGVMSNDNFSITIYNINGTAVSYIVNGSELIPFSEFDTQIGDSAYEIDIITYFSGSWIAETMYSVLDNSYETLKFYDGTDGTLLQTLSLTGDTYNNYDISPYGDNKIVGYFYNNNDSNVDYLIFQYDGNTDTLITTSHVVVNYESRNMFTNRNLFSNHGGSEAFVIKLSTVVSSNNLGDVVSYCDLIYMLSGDTDFTTYVFQDSGTGDKTIKYYLTPSNIINGICDNGDGNASSLVINSSGVTITSSGILTSANVYSETSPVGNGIVNLFFTDDTSTGCTITYINGEGVVSDTISGITFNGGNQFDNRSTGGLYIFSNRLGDDYYINEMSDLFQTGNTLVNSGTTNYYYVQSKFRSDFLEPSIILSVDYNTKEYNILSSTGYTEHFDLYEIGEYGTSFNIVVGDDKFMYTFYDLSGNININLYDFNGNKLNNLVTEHTSYSSRLACGNSFVQQISENGNYYIYLVSETEISPSILTNNNDYYTFNDYVWWDNEGS